MAKRLFIADVMLGKTARWLRIMGQRVLEPENEADEKILEQARRAGAVLLTSDVRLADHSAKHKVRALLIPRKLELDQQLALVAKAFRLRLSNFPSETICPTCNGPLKLVKKNEVKELVHPNVYARHGKFWRCFGKCRRVYWAGSHWRKIGERVRRVRKLATSKSGPV